MTIVEGLINLGVFLIGLVIVAFTLFSAIRMVVLPRGDNVWLTRTTFRLVYGCFLVRLRRINNYEQADRVLAFYAPVALLIIPVVWMVLAIAGFTCMFWAVGEHPWSKAFLLSGSSMLTLGFAAVDSTVETILAFLAATVGLGIVALLIAYLPTMYGAFSKREEAVTLLEVRAGTPPSAITMIQRYQRIHNLERMPEQWAIWEQWFAELEESHTTFAALAFFRSPQPYRSWITASAAVLDAAALAISTIDIPRQPDADLCIRAGYLALRRIADLYMIPYNAMPHADDPISITRAEFDLACAELIDSGVPLKADRDQAWRDFAGWRVNYDQVLIELAKLVTAPPAPWTGERPLPLCFNMPRFGHKRRQLAKEPTGSI